MRKLVTVFLSTTLALALSTSLAAPAYATGSLCTWFPIHCKDSTPPRAPEIDPGVARSAVAVLAGGVLMLAERRRRR